MKIWGNIPKVTGVYGGNGKISKPSRVGETISGKDELSISDSAKDFSIVMKALRLVPDVRQDRVNEVLQKMERGEYSVKSSDVADKIVNALNSREI